MPSGSETAYAERTRRRMHQVLRADQIELADAIAEGSRRRCPEGCNKRLPLNAISLHLNDDHRWTREQIVSWLRK